MRESQTNKCQPQSDGLKVSQDIHTAIDIVFFYDDQSGKARFSANLGQLLAEVDRVVSQVSDERDPLQRHALGAQQILLELHQGSSGINSIKLYSSVIRGGPQGRTYL